MAREKIEELSSRQQAREKISVWFGSSDNIYHPLVETIVNSIDEINNNFEKGQVEITIDNKHSKDGTLITVKDSGRGIPIGGETNGKKNCTLLFEKMFAGTKYHDTGEVNTGTNGVGNTVINFTSKQFECKSRYDNVLHVYSTSNGGQNLNYRENDDVGPSFSQFSFILDDSIYTSDRYADMTVQSIIEHFSVVANKIRFLYKFIGEKDEDSVEKTFHFDNIRQYFEQILHGQNTSPIVGLKEPVKIQTSETNVYDLLLTTTPEVIQQSYLNGTYLSKGGTINFGIVDGVRKFLNEYCKDKKLFNKQVKTVDREDVENSISFLANVDSSKVEYENQIKIYTQKKLYRSQIKDIVYSQLKLQAVTDSTGFKKLVNHVFEVHKNNTLNDRAQKRLKNKLTKNINSLTNRVERLKDCDKHGDQSELFIVEGLSALGSIMSARDSQYQAVYPLTGKILNTLKAKPNQIINNTVILDLVKTIGTGMNLKISKNKHMDFDITKSRFGKIICAADADADGFQINSLVITLIHKLMPDFINQGRVYIVQTPLYIISYRDDTKEYLHTEDEKAKWKPSKNIPYTISRAKGLGELNADILAETGMDVKTRNIIQITNDNVLKFEKYLNIWMGISSDGRKSEIDQNLYKYIDEVD